MKSACDEAYGFIAIDKTEQQKNEKKKEMVNRKRIDE